MRSRWRGNDTARAPQSANAIAQPGAPFPSSQRLHAVLSYHANVQREQRKDAEETGERGAPCVRPPVVNVPRSEWAPGAQSGQRDARARPKTTSGGTAAALRLSGGRGSAVTTARKKRESRSPLFASLQRLQSPHWDHLYIKPDLFPGIRMVCKKRALSSAPVYDRVSGITKEYQVSSVHTAASRRLAV